MKTYDELTNDILEKTKSEKARRATIRRRVTSAALALVIVLGAAFVGRVVLKKEKLPEYSGIEKDLPDGAVETRIISTDTPSGSLSAKSDYAAIYANLIVPERDDDESVGLLDKVKGFVTGLFGADKSEDVVKKSAGDDAEPSAAENDVRAAAPKEEAADYAENESLAGAEYSQTNVQVAGIDEADVVKTDGKYIYAISHRNVYIYEAKDGEMTLVSKARFIKEDGALVSTADDGGEPLYKNYVTPELYFTEDRLIVVIGACESTEQNYKESDKVVRNDVYYPYYGAKNDYFCAMVYDVSDKASPSLISVSAVSGSGVSSRMIGDTLYLVASDRYYDVDRDDPETFIPTVYNDGEKALVPSDTVFCPPEPSECFYLNALEFDAASCETKSSVSLLGYSADIMYQSENAIYVARTAYDDSEDRYDVEPGKLTQYYSSSPSTTITKLSLDGGIALAGSTNVEGTLLNSFSMDEYDGYLRVVTSVRKYVDETTWYAKDGYVPADTTYIDWEHYYDGTGKSEEEMYNDLFILDGSLTVVGSLTNIAPDERIYSCRFEGTQGYFVTYRETDPLFHVDMTDPTAPKIVGELKLPGYSAYLQRFGEYMLGFGMNDNGELKVSMFSENEDGTMDEIDNISIKNASYSEALYDHHAILADASRGIICFGASVYIDYNGWDNYYSGVKYFVLSYGENGFELKTSFDMGSAWPEQMRGFYIGDYFYIYQDSSEKSAITSLDFGSFEIADEETMDAPEDYVYGDYGVVCYD